GAGRRGLARLLGDAGGRARRALLRGPAHPVPGPDDLPQATVVGLAELRIVGGGGLAGGAEQGEPDLEGAACRVRAATDGRGAPRRAPGLCRPAGRSKQRPDRPLASGLRAEWGRARRERGLRTTV